MRSAVLNEGLTISRKFSKGEGEEGRSTPWSNPESNTPAMVPGRGGLSREAQGQTRERPDLVGAVRNAGPRAMPAT
jgi:hypothetical protein